MWQREAHSKRDGVMKLGVAFVLAPMVASFLWALPLVAFASLLLADDREYLAGNYTFFEVFVRLAINNCRISLWLCPPAFLAFLLFFRKLKLRKISNLYAFVIGVVITALLTFSLYDAGIKQLLEGGVFKALKGIIFIIVVLGVPASIVAISIAWLFWHLGIKNNHWLHGHNADAKT